MTLEELSKFDGKEGRKAYIAYHGKVYDISDSDFWPAGKHMGMFEAGKDLSEFLCQSPHGDKNIVKYPCVAEMEGGGATAGSSDGASKPVNKKAKYIALYAKYHPHPMLVHYPMALFPFALLLQIINICIGGELFVYGASVMAFTFATVMTIPAIKTGVLSLWINYNCKPNKFIKRKIILSVALLIVGVIGSLVSIMDLHHLVLENMGITGFGVNTCYTVLCFISFILVSGLGFYGGKITWGHRG